ncbi:MAG: sensor histidine kinase [Aeromicrobium erythreum]
MSTSSLWVTGNDRSALGRMIGAGIWLVFLVNPLGELAQDPWSVRSLVGFVAVAAFVALYLVGLRRVRDTHVEQAYGAAVARVALAAVVACVFVWAAGDQGLVVWVYVAALAAASMPSWSGLVVAFALFVGVAVAGRVVPGWSAHGNDFAVLLATGAVWSFRLAMQRQARLSAAERELSELAVEEERSRIARDLHDILGHSLTVISVKSELAARLVQGDPARAQAELEDVQRLARDALADVRATTRGLRGLSLPTEVAEARSALESAGIEPDLPTVTEDVPTRWRELYAWALREAVTNAVRHSHASRVEVTMDEHGLRVVDDGVGAPARDEGDRGTGLDGLRQRAQELGAVVTTGPGPAGRGFAVEVVVPS